MNELDTANAKIKELEREIAVLRRLPTDFETNARLRKQGLDNGSTGVKAAFCLIAFIFIVTVLFEFKTERALQAAPSLVALGAVLCVALVAYFGFIFKFTVSAELSQEKMAIATAHARDA